MIINKNLFKTKKLYLLFGFFAILLFSDNVIAQTANTPWPMFRQNPQHTGLRGSGLSNEPEFPKVKFKIDTGPGFITDVTSSPSINDDGIIFVGSLAKDFFAIDPESGKIVATFTTGNSITSSPAIGEDGRIYIGSWDGTLYVLRFDKDSGFSLINFHQARTENFGHLEGIIGDASVGGTISGASISVGGFSTTSDNNGNFTLLNVPKGNQTVIVSSGGKDCDNIFTVDICGFQRTQSTGIINLHNFTSIGETGIGVCPESSETLVCSLDENRAFVSIDDIVNIDPGLIENGINSSPLIGFNNWVYWGSINNRFYGWDVDQGRVWNKDIGGQIISSPVQSTQDGTVYVITLNGELHAFNPDFSVAFPSLEIGGQVKSSPAVGIDGTLYFGSLNDTFYAVQPDNTLKWTFSTGGQIVSSPAIDENGIIYFGSKDGNLYAIEDLGVDSPNLKWSKFVGSEIAGSSPSIGNDGVIYIGVSGEFPKVIAVNKNGDIEWCFSTENGMNSTPTIGEDGTIYISSVDGKVYGLENDSQGNNSIGTDSLFSVSGTIVDENSVPVKDVAINISFVVNENEKISCGNTLFDSDGVSDSNGKFVFNDVPEGNYNISFAHKNFEDVVFENVKVDNNLEVDGNGETVKVENNVPVKNVSPVKLKLLDSEDVSAGRVISITGITMEKDSGTCIPLKVQFKSIINPPIADVDYLWNFDDGETSTEKSPVHDFSEVKTFNVTLKITEKLTFETATNKIDVNVTEGPCVRFEPMEKKAKVNSVVNFRDLTVTSDGRVPDIREWEFSSNLSLSGLSRRNTSKEVNPSHKFRRTGVHTVKLFISQQDGSDGFAFGTITVVRDF